VVVDIVSDWSPACLTAATMAMAGSRSKTKTRSASDVQGADVPSLNVVTVRVMSSILVLVVLILTAHGLEACVAERAESWPPMMIAGAWPLQNAIDTTRASLAGRLAPFVEAFAIMTKL
jgi:hypothetical protein